MICNINKFELENEMEIIFPEEIKENIKTTVKNLDNLRLCLESTGFMNCERWVQINCVIAELEDAYEEINKYCLK